MRTRTTGVENLGLPNGYFPAEWQPELQDYDGPREMTREDLGLHEPGGWMTLAWLDIVRAQGAILGPRTDAPYAFWLGANADVCASCAFWLGADA